MFVGASPGGTGGGIKTTTFATIIATIWATLRGLRDTIIFKRRIPFQTVRRSFSILFLSASLIFGALLLLDFTEDGMPLIALIFEIVSAFGTVGLSMGITPFLSPIGKIIIMLVMFVGRVGPLGLLLSLMLNQKDSKVEYPKEGISIG